MDAILAISQLHHADFPAAQKPLSPPPPPVDAAKIRDDFATAAVKGISLFDRAGRKAAKVKASGDADARIRHETEELRRQYDEYQQGLDQWWSRLLANDPDAVLYQLADAFEDNEAAAAPVGVNGDEVTIVVLLPGDNAVPERMPSTTAAGNLSLKKMTKKEHDAFYAMLAAGYVLVTAKEAFAVAPALGAVRIVAVRGTGTNAYGKKKGEALLATKIRKDATAGVQWTTVDAATVLNDISDELLVNQKGVNKTLSALDLAKEPDLAEVVASIDFDELE
jgi:hypothetical protein